MNQRELTSAVKKNLHYKVDITEHNLNIIIDTLFDTIQETVSDGDKVTIRNFGTFSPKERRQVTKILPEKGNVVIPAKTVPSFKPGKGFLEKTKGNLKNTEIEVE